MINVINDGEPITYALLNAIIEQVNLMSNTSDTNTSQDITVVGGNIQNTEDEKVKIAVGDVSIDVPKEGKTKILTQKFPASGFKSNPYVTATVVDYQGEGQGISFANVTITAIRKTEFDYRVQLVSTLKKDTTIRINYIAVGRSD